MGDLMTTLSKPETDTEKELAECIIARYNTRLRCLSCNTIRPRGAFNRDQAGRNKDNEPSRRYVCKGKASSECGKTYSPRNLWFLAREQLNEEELAFLTNLFPTATRAPPASELESQPIADDSISLKRARDPSPTGLTPSSKRVSVGVDLTIPPPSMHLDPHVLSSDDLSSAIHSGHVDDLDYLSQLLEAIKGRIAHLELERPASPQVKGESQEISVEALVRSSHSPVPPPQSPIVLPSHRDVTALKWDLTVIYLTFLDESKTKVGIIRERLAGTGLKVLNVSVMGTTHIEVLVEGLDTEDSKSKALSAGFGVLPDFDPTDPEETGSQDRASFIRRVNREIKTSRRQRVREFYREWLQLLGWAVETGTK